MTGRNEKAAGGKPPAASASEGPDIVWTERGDAPVYEVTLWPNRSLSPKGKRGVLWLVAAGLAVPMLPALGTPVFWGLLPFEVLAWAALWFSFRRNEADSHLSESVAVWTDEVRVERTEPSGRVLRWRADPYWVRLTLHDDAKVESYLTMKGGGREIELGAFLSPDERVQLSEEIEAAIRKALVAGAGGAQEPG